MVIAFITSLLVYFQNLTNFSISIDTEYAFFHGLMKVFYGGFL